MTLVLKSNVNLVSGRVTDNLTVQPMAYADFRTGDYFVDGQSQSISDIITVNQSAVSGVYDLLGNYTQTPPNSARISVDRGSLEKGLLIEETTNNILVDPLNVKNQTVTLNSSASSLSTKAFLLSVVGSGSVRMEIPEDNYNETATEGKPIYFRPQVAGSLTASIFVEGVVEYASLIIPRSPVEPVIRSDAAYVNDEVKLKDSIVGNLEEFTVIIEFFTPTRLFPAHYLPNPYAGILQVQGAAFGGLGVLTLSRHEPETGGYIRFRKTTSQTLSTLTDSSSLSHKNVVAIRVGNSDASFAINGQYGGEFTHELDSITDIFIGGGSAVSPSRTLYVQQLAVVDSQLNNADLEKASSRFT
ncbi:MAG: hypothetical protein ACPHVJ_00315 [Psychrobacter sp.]